jgi:uncharacterized protein (DUF433 family)
MADPIDLLGRPIYGMAEVDWVLGLSAGTARRWIDGYVRGGREYPPVVRPDPTGDELVTWGEFVETRLLAEFRDAGVPMVRMRPAVVCLRERFGVSYPLAYARPWLATDGKEIVLRIQDEVELDKRLRFVVVRNDQLLLTPPAVKFVESVVFEREVASRIRPVSEFMHVFLDPERQAGAPVVRSVPTAVIVEQYRAGDPPDMIADLYELPEEHVHEAIRYEIWRAQAGRAA